jgi:hypothetical protein
MTGVTPRMGKLYDGRNVATRPIPVIVDISEARANAAAAADQRPKGTVVNMPSKPRPSGADTIFGTQIPGTNPMGNSTSGVYDPMVGIDHTM